MRRSLLALAACCAALAAGPAAAAAQNGSTVGLLTFNVLAPVWASPVWYPDGMDATLLDAATRRARIGALLAAHADQTDVACLQEVQESEFPSMLAALGGGFTGAMSHNDRDWWSNWVVPEIPWAPNGTALVVRRQAFSGVAVRDVPLTGDGNHAVLMTGVHRATGRPVRAISVHLDSDIQANRTREAREVARLLPPAAGTADIVCGDLNEDSITGAAGNVLQRAGFADVLASVGIREPTHPWSSTYNGATRWAIIDHLLVRGAAPVSGDVLDFGVWAIEDEVARIEANFVNTGSDHFPVAGVADLGP